MRESAFTAPRLPVNQPAAYGCVYHKMEITRTQEVAGARPPASELPNLRERLKIRRNCALLHVETDSI